MALVDLYLYSVLMQCLTSVSTGEKRSNPTSPMTSSDMTIKRQWRSGSESGEFPPRVSHLWFIKLVQQHVPTSSILHRQCKTSVTLYPSLGLFKTDPDWFCPLCLNRKCALVALDDVKTYLNEEGGQIAVRAPKRAKAFFIFIAFFQEAQIEITFILIIACCVSGF